MSSLSRIGPHTWSGATCSRAGERSPRLGQPEHVGVGVGGHPLGVDEDVLHHPPGLGQPGVGVVSESFGYAERQPRAASRTSASASASWSGRVSKRPGTGRGHRVGQRVRGLGEPVGGVALAHVPLGAPGGPLDVEHRELVGGRLGDAGDDLVGLVDDDHVVVGDHRHPLDRVDRQERVVGDDQVRALGLLARPLGEALLGEGALGGAEALAVVDADLPPDPVGVPRRVVALAGAARPASSSAHARSLRTSAPCEPVGTSTSTPWSSGTPSRIRCRQA